jgi:ribulose-bisphosphate carboxylase large chain
MRYEDFIDLSYKPSKRDLVCEFILQPADGVSIGRGAGAIAAESSIGTWTEVKTEKRYVRGLAAKVFEIKGGKVRIAYPVELFEQGNIPQILSSIAGNIFGMKEIKNLRLTDLTFPAKLLKSFKGPKHGIKGIRKIFKVERPLLGTIIKPKIGLKTEDHVKVAYEAWINGIDIVKDDENLSSQSFNRFEKRLEKTFKAKEKAEKETGEKKAYMINITAETQEMLKRAKAVETIGNEYVMVDIITVGWSALQTLRNQDFELVIHAHRAGHAALTRNPEHGISMKVIAKLARIVGVDQLHVGTGLGKMFEEREEVLENCKALKEKMWKFKPVMPVASGGLHPGMIPELVNIFGKDVVLQFGGGCHGHPLGTAGGAKAIRQAVEAVEKGFELEEYAKTHRELKIALERWSSKHLFLASQI